MAWYTELDERLKVRDAVIEVMREDIRKLQEGQGPTPPEPEPEPPEPAPPTPTPPTPTPTPTPANKIGTGRSYRNLNPGQHRIWEFVPTNQEKSKRLQVSNTPQPTQPHTVFMLIKKGSKPTLADFEKTWNMPVSTWRGSMWWPPKPGAENLYWQYSSGTELVEILDNPVGNDRYFIMLYNKGSKPVWSQRLIVMCSV